MKIYGTSKVIHAHMWRSLRSRGVPIISTWIDESGLGETSDWYLSLWDENEVLPEAVKGRPTVPEILKKIGTIDLIDANRETLKSTLDIARNGKFYLVEDRGQDDYGNSINRALRFDQGLNDWSSGDFIDSLVQVIGGLIIERDALAAQLASAVRAKE